MKSVRQNRRKVLRSLILYILGLNLLAWAGWMLAQEGSVEAAGLGSLVWLAAPLLVSLLIRLFTRDWTDMGLKLHLRGNGKWYLFSIVVFPVLIAAVLLLGMITGSTSLQNFQNVAFLQSAAAAFISFTLIKNLFEEFAWRGYLTPRMNQVVNRPILGHLLVGLVWGTWHIPYYLALVDSATLSAYTSLDLSTFIPMVILGMTLAGILFGEIRLLTGSTWPAYLMHMVSNALILTLLTGGFVEVNPGREILFTPSWEGILMMAFLVLAGLWVYRRRTAG